MIISRRNISKLLLVSSLGLITPGLGLAAVRIPLRKTSSLGQAFSDYLQQQENEFADFNDFYTQAYQDYVAGIEANWGANPILRNQTLWVDYSTTVRRMVNFKQGYAEVAIARQSSNQPLSQLIIQAKNILQQLFTSSTKKILDADPLERQIRKKIQRGDIEALTQNKNKDTSVFSSVAPEKNALRQAEAKEKTLLNGKKIITVRVPINNDPVSKRAPFFAAIKTNAKRYNLPPALISAIIEAESSFNPLATSSVPAFGLMQIVPTTAGVDVASYLYQKKYLLSPEWLYSASNNVLAGSTYLHIVQSKYLNAIKNSKSKLHCAIASYNTGIGNMAKAFSNSGLADAIAKINKQTPKQIYRDLVKKLPFQETRNYLEKVTDYIEKWTEQ